MVTLVGHQTALKANTTNVWSGEGYTINKRYILDHTE